MSRLADADTERTTSARARSSRPLFKDPGFSVRSRAPLRLGLAGGGTDLPAYSDQFGGAVLNVTIDRFAFAHVMRHPEGLMAFRASDIPAQETYRDYDEVRLDGGLVLHKAVFRHVVDTYLGGVAPPLIVSTSIDAPAGSGLGSSSALVVALIEAFRTALDLPLGRYDLARLAFEIERIELNLAGGGQDHYAAAFGGFNFIEFLPDRRVVVNPLRAPRSHLNEFESSLLICFSGQSRRSEKIIEEQIAGLAGMNAGTLEGMHRLKADASEMKDAILEGRIREAAEILNGSWQAKKKTASGVVTDTVERLFACALANGAWGGKLSGAGGGGFLMFCTEPERRYRLIQALNAEGGEAGPIKLTFDGAEAWRTPG